MDTIRLPKPRSNNDKRLDYRYTVLRMALEATKADYGEYELIYYPPNCSRERELIEIASGVNINVCIVPTSFEWEKAAIPIRIPIMKGILGYRLLLIKKHNANAFAELKTVADLKKFSVGSGRGWPLSTVLAENAFPVTTCSDYEGLFRMLLADRFDYFPRGLNDVFTELDNRPKLSAHVAIEGTKALHIPMPVYIFVSHEYPEIAARVREGFQRILHSGAFDGLFTDYHCASLRKARLDKRLIFKVENQLLPPATPFSDKRLWFTPSELDAMCP